MINFTPPKIENLEQAEMMLKTLQESQIEIEGQLGLKVRHHPDGREFEGWEYRNWKQRAKIALMYRKKEILYVKEWIKSRRKLEAGKHDKRTNRVAKGILGDISEALDLFIQMKSAGVPDNEAKEEVLNQIGMRFGIVRNPDEVPK